jgi:hypothetical protein
MGIDLVDDLKSILLVPLLTDPGKPVLRCQLVTSLSPTPHQGTAGDQISHFCTVGAAVAKEAAAEQIGYLKSSADSAW